nr:MAG TPA: hypothetical protein [Caudoviricetes sp.]
MKSSKYRKDRPRIIVPERSFLRVFLEIFIYITRFCVYYI